MHCSVYKDHMVFICILLLEDCTVTLNVFLADTYTIQQAIDNIGFGKFQVKLSILTGVAWVCYIKHVFISK